MPYDATVEPNQLEYELIFTKARALEVLERMREDEFWALDFETTALDPSLGEVRLTSVSNGAENYLFDHWNCGSFKELMPLFVGPTYIVFFAGFEYKWFDHVEYGAVTLWDVGIMRKAKLGGGGYGLAGMADFDLNIKMAKDMQVSDWGADSLNDMQLNYGMYDAYVTWLLFDYWCAELSDSNWDGFHVINDVWRANIEMEDTGFHLDTGYHAVNLKRWALKAATAKTAFERWTPTAVIKNINSNQQVSNFLKEELPPELIEPWPTTPSGKDLSLARETLVHVIHNLSYPMSRWMVAFLIYRLWSKYVSTYGEKLIYAQNVGGRVRGRLNVAAAKTGRYSSSSPNIQNIPKKQYIRKAFCVPPLSGEKIVLADYTGIEIRVLAEISGDNALLFDAIHGDMHGAMAAIGAGIPENEFAEVLKDKEHKDYHKYRSMRSNAKPGSFQLTYGAGVATIAVSIKKPYMEAEKFVDAWEARYPKAYGYRHLMMECLAFDGFIPVVDGRTIYVPKPDRAVPVAANYPVQGAAASVMYRALYHVHKLLDEEGVTALMASTVHDEIILYAQEDSAEAAGSCLVRGMELGWLDIFPGTSIENLLESAIGDDWGVK